MTIVSVLSVFLLCELQTSVLVFVIYVYKYLLLFISTIILNDKKYNSPLVDDMLFLLLDMVA